MTPLHLLHSPHRPTGCIPLEHDAFLRFRAVLALLLSVLLTGCGTFGPSVTQDETYDFADSKKYAFSTAPRKLVGVPGIDSPEFDRFMQREISEILKAKGLTLVPVEEADILVAYNADTEEVVRTISVGLQEDLGYTTNRPRLPESSRTDLPDDYRLGILRVTVKDKVSGQTVWTSETKTRLDTDNPEAQKKSVQRNLREIFAAYPLRGR